MCAARTLVLPRTCAVLSLVTEDSFQLDIRYEELISAVKAAEVADLDLFWHDIVYRDPSDLVNQDDYEQEDDDDPDKSKPRLIAVCSVAKTAFSNKAEDTILRCVSGCCVGGSAVIKKCEVWLTAPCLVPLFARKTQDLCITDTPQGISAMKEFGMCIMPTALKADSVSAILAAAEHRIRTAETLVAHKRPDLRLGHDLFAFAEFSSRGGHRFDLLFAEDDPHTAAVFHVAHSAPWVPVIAATLGADFRCMASVVYSRPGAEAQDWHTDGAHLGRSTAGWAAAAAAAAAAAETAATAASDAYAICVFVALIPLDRQVGFTQFWPGTHRHAGLVGFGGAATVLGCAVDGLVGAGGCVMYDYRLMHRGMGNRSAATQRPILQLLYHAPSYVETKNYGAERLFEW